MMKRILDKLGYKLVLLVCGWLVTWSIMAGSQNGLVINSVYQDTGGVRIGFTAVPSDCAGEFKSAHALIPLNHPEFDILYKLAITQRILKKPVLIEYNDNGDCISADTLLQIIGIKQ